MELIFTEGDGQTRVCLTGAGSEIYEHLTFDFTVQDLASRASLRQSASTRWNECNDVSSYLTCLKEFYTDFIQVTLLQYVEQTNTYKNSWMNTLLSYTNARTFKPEVTYRKLACIEAFLNNTAFQEEGELTVCDLFFSFDQFKQALATIDRQYWTSLSKSLSQIEVGLNGFRQVFSALYVSGGMAEKIQKDVNTVWNFKNTQKDILHLPWIDSFGCEVVLKDVSTPTHPLKKSVCGQKLVSTELVYLGEFVDKNNTLLDRVGELNGRKDLRVLEYVELKIIAEFEKKLDSLVKEYFKPQRFLDAATRGEKRHISGLGVRRRKELQDDVVRLVGSLFRRTVFFRVVLQQENFAQCVVDVANNLAGIAQNEAEYDQVERSFVR
jgi:hypothetical protein